MDDWTFNLFSNTGKALFVKAFRARNATDADERGVQIYGKVANRFRDAEDWVVEPVTARTAARPLFVGPSRKRKRIDRGTLEALQAGPVASNRQIRMARRILKKS